MEYANYRWGNASFPTLYNLKYWVYFHSLVVALFHSVFTLTFRLIGECPNFLETIVPNALKGCLCALNFAPIRY